MRDFRQLNPHGMQLGKILYREDIKPAGKPKTAMILFPSSKQNPQRNNPSLLFDSRVFRVCIIS